MHHPETLITTIVVGIVLAFALGMLATRLRLSPLVGYLVAGVLVGPFTPGYVADTELAPQLAEIGVILLMFGVGLHFSIKELWAVSRIAVPGAVVQMATATALGAVVAHGWGLPLAGGVAFGFSLSVASTVVLLRALEDRRALASEAGRIAVGWLIVEDLAIVLALVLLPVLASLADPAAAQQDPGQIALTVGTVLAKIALFVALMLVVGARLLPSLLVRIAKLRSREMMSLGVLAMALGIAFLAYEVFGASFALGAFFAGLVLNNSEIGHKAGEQILPLRDAFAVLFFVSVGMLFDPMILLQEPLAVGVVLLIVVLGKSLAALAITVAFRQPLATGLTIAASLAQIGEFSFVFAGTAVALGLMPESLRDLVLAAAMLSIALNPFVFAGVAWLAKHLAAGRAAEPKGQAVA